MSELILRFETIKKKGADFDVPVPVSVKYGDKDAEQFKFNNPLTDKDLSEIRWYLEQYYYWPSDIDRDRARAVEGNLPKWGKVLFDAVFQKASNAMRLFGDFDRADGERVLTIDTNEPRILRLPWELLRDEGGYLFSKKPPVSIRRHMHKTAGKPIQPFDLPARILMVTCRPDGAGFIDPRSIAVPLLDALDDIPEQVEVEFLRPPTLRALDDRLRDPNQPRVHIVHFDGHGVYDKGIGLGFLLFEDEKHEKHLVDAEQLGTLLNESGIPLMVLNACQSAQPDDRNPFGSVASRLIESGVGGVVAMNYSVLVETAKRFTSEFYGALARGQNASAAMDSARRRLFSDTKRFTFTRPNQEEAEILHLQDWFLPALYQQAETLTPFAPSPQPSPAGGGSQFPSPTGRGARGEGERGSFPPAPLHGFHGRARELLDLERAFATRNIIVLHGFGGQGKTSLATQAAEWFTRTRLFERAAFISFETGASLDFVLNELGNALVEENFQIHEGDKIQAIAQSLKEKPALVVFDNFESALPGGNAPMPDLQALLDAAATWFAPSPATRHSSLLVTTRNPEIPHPSFTPSKTCLHKELSGLAPSDALELAASILEAYSLPRPPRLPLEELLTFLKGHPLSLQLALPQLRDYSAGQLVEQYQSILPQMKKGEAKERNESLEVSLRFSLDRLGKDSIALLTRLAVFEGGALEPYLLSITEISENTWNVLKLQLTSTAMIRLEEIPEVNAPFIHFHPTLSPYLRAQIQSDQSLFSSFQSIQKRYWQSYLKFGSELYKLDAQYTTESRHIVARELPNLRRSLSISIAVGEVDAAISFAEIINWFLDHFGRWMERDEVASEVDKMVEKGREKKKESKAITESEFLTERGRGERLLQQGRAVEAEEIFHSLLQRFEDDTTTEWGFQKTVCLQQIGRCLRSQGHPSDAMNFFYRAITLSKDLEQTEQVKGHISHFHTDLGNVFADLGQYAEAKKEFNDGLKLKREMNDNRGIAVSISQLGKLALLQGDLKEARKNYLDAQAIFQHLGEYQTEALTWHQLGVVAHQYKDYEEAERCYKKSLTIKERLSDFHGAARTCCQLASLADDGERPDEAERWYSRAIKYFEEVGDSKLLSDGVLQLALLMLGQNRLDEAETYARRALAIKETLDLSSEPWKTYNILAQIAEKCGRMDEVREWRRKEQESFAAFAGSDTQIKKHEPLIAAIVAASQGNQEALAQVEPTLLNMEKGNDTNRAFAKSARRILAGERDFGILTEGLSRTPSLIIRRVLQALNGDEMPSPQPSPEIRERGQTQPPEQQGVTLPQLLELVERAAAGGDKELGGQLFTAFQQMSRAEDATSSALGNVLLRVLVGERQPDLSKLPDEIASAVRGLLGRLKNK